MLLIQEINKIFIFHRIHSWKFLCNLWKSTKFVNDTISTSFTQIYFTSLFMSNGICVTFFLWINFLLLNRKSDFVGAENLSNKDRYYPTRGSTVVFEESGPTHAMLGLDEKGPFVLPRFFISLSNKEKEEDFMAMKGCKLPQRPKKRSKSMQKCLLVCTTLFFFLFCMLHYFKLHFQQPGLCYWKEFKRWINVCNWYQKIDKFG